VTLIGHYLLRTLLRQSIGIRHGSLKKCSLAYESAFRNCKSDTGLRMYIGGMRLPTLMNLTAGLLVIDLQYLHVRLRDDRV